MERKSGVWTTRDVPRTFPQRFEDNDDIFSCRLNFLERQISRKTEFIREITVYPLNIQRGGVNGFSRKGFEKGGLALGSTNLGYLENRPLPTPLSMVHVLQSPERLVRRILPPFFQQDSAVGHGDKLPPTLCEGSGRVHR